MSISITLKSFSVLFALVLIGFILSRSHDIAQRIVFGKAIKWPRGDKLKLVSVSDVYFGFIQINDADIQHTVLILCAHLIIKDDLVIQIDIL